MPAKISRHKKLLEVPSIRRWYNNLSRGSIITAENRLGTLGFVCETWGKSPEGLLEQAKRDQGKFENDLSDFVDLLFAKGERADNIANKLKAVRSWLDFNGVRINRKIKVGTSEPPQERVPSKEELSRFFRFCTPRERAAAAFIAFSGLRLESLGNYMGTDGLLISDLPELTIVDGKVEAKVLPMKVNIRSSLSKARNNYFTFLPAEGFSYLKEYLEMRLKRGESLNLDDPVIGHEKPSVKKFNRTTKIGFSIKECIVKAGFSWRPYILRAYCATMYDIAEARGLISHPWRQFFMGHKGDIEARYSTNKGLLPPDMVEEMRKCYKACEPLLTTATSSLEQSNVIKEAKIEALKSIAKSLLGIDLLEVKVAREKELDKELSNDETIELFEGELKKLRDGKHNPQRVIREEDLEKHLAEGWQFVSTLASQKILLRKEQLS